MLLNFCPIVGLLDGHSVVSWVEGFCDGRGEYARIDRRSYAGKWYIAVYRPSPHGSVVASRKLEVPNYCTVEACIEYASAIYDGKFPSYSEVLYGCVIQPWHGRELRPYKGALSDQEARELGLLRE